MGTVVYTNWSGAYANFRFRVVTCDFVLNFSHACTPAVIFADHFICLRILQLLRTLLDVVLALQASCFTIRAEAMLAIRWRAATCVFIAVGMFAEYVL